MDGSSADGQASTMEVDGEASAMDTDVEELGAGPHSQAWDQNTKHGMTEPPAVPAPCGLLSQERAWGVDRQVWLLPEGACEKSVLQQGEGLYGPVCGACCTVTLQAVHSAGGLDPSHHVGYPLGHGVVQIGEGTTPVACLIESALMTMKKGESSRVVIQGLRSLDGEFVFHLTLHDFTADTPPWRLPPGEKCSRASAHKEKGVRLFKEGNVFAAFSQFRTAIRLLLSVLPYQVGAAAVEEEEAEAAAKSYQQLLCQCYLNLAACQAKTGHHGHVVANCTQALSADPSSIKALYRRAVANVSLGNYLLAQEDLQTGLRKEPCNRAFLDLIHTVNSKLAPSESRMVQGLSKMFS